MVGSSTGGVTGKWLDSGDISVGDACFKKDNTVEGDRKPELKHGWLERKKKSPVDSGFIRHTRFRVASLRLLMQSKG